MSVSVLMDVSSLNRQNGFTSIETLARVGYKGFPGIGQIIIGIDSDLIHVRASDPANEPDLPGPARLFHPARHEA